MKRLFCAVHIEANQQIIEVFQSLREELSHERIRWVQPQNLHLTLKFFGDTPPEKEEQIKKVLSMKPFGDIPSGQEEQIKKVLSMKPFGDTLSEQEKRIKRVLSMKPFGDTPSEKEEQIKKVLSMKPFGDTLSEQEEQVKKTPGSNTSGDTPADSDAPGKGAVKEISHGPESPPPHNASAPFPHDGAGETLGPFSLEIRGCGVFGPARSPRVIWLGVEDGGCLRRLVLRINKALEPLGTLPDKKAFAPHLTVGRIRQLNEPGRLNKVIASYKDTSFGFFTVSELKLYQSILRPEGPQYKCLQSIRLSPGPQGPTQC